MAKTRRKQPEVHFLPFCTDFQVVVLKARNNHKIKGFNVNLTFHKVYIVGSTMVFPPLTSDRIVEDFLDQFVHLWFDNKPCFA